MSYPLRVEIATVLTGGLAKSAPEVAKELNEPVERVRSQLRELVTAGIAKVAESRRRRGTVEKFYVGVPEAMNFGFEELQAIPLEKRRRLAAVYLKVGFREALRALSNSVTMARPGTTMARTPFRLDERGWGELAAIYRDTFDRLQKLRVESSSRIVGTDEDLISATAVLLCFERPPVT